HSVRHAPRRIAPGILDLAGDPRSRVLRNPRDEESENCDAESCVCHDVIVRSLAERPHAHVAAVALDAELAAAAVHAPVAFARLLAGGGIDGIADIDLAESGARVEVEGQLGRAFERHLAEVRDDLPAVDAALLSRANVHVARAALGAQRFEHAVDVDFAEAALRVELALDPFGFDFAAR